MPHAIVISGALAQSACSGGLTWCFLQFMLGFRRLRWEVLFLDRLAPEVCVNQTGMPATLDRSINLRYFLRVMETFGLGESFYLSYHRGEQVIGLPRERLL